ncbi:MAG: hypothetical protein JW976_03510 [Syntrophaceae bacterium]|nr:hypothetical protein [Syntrophaceae bacterium]
MAKIFWQQLAHDSQYFVRGLRCKNSYFHHSLEKNVNTLWEWAGVYPIITNSLGFRDFSNRKIPFVSDKKRIILMGDSFTEGIGPYEKTYSGIISKVLQKKNIEVLNASVMSYSPKLYFLKTQYLLEKLKLKCETVIVFVDISDIQDEIFYKNYIPENHDTGKGIDFYLKLYMIKYSVIGNILDRILSNNSGIPFEDRANKWLGVFDDKTIGKQELICGIWKNENDMFREKAYWYVDSNFKKWGFDGSMLAKLYMNKLVNLCKANNVDVIIAVYPWPEQLKENIVENRHMLLWKEFANEHKIRFINFFAYFMSAEPNKVIDLYYIPGDIHFNEAGNMLIAQEFLKWFEREYK